MDTRHIERVYDRDAPRFNTHLWLLERMLISRLRRRLLSTARGRVLEVGVGTGLNLPYYPAVCTVTAVDISEGMLAQARKAALRLGISVTFMRMDAEALLFADESFDTVVATLTLCTVPNPLRALQEMRRVVRSDGRVLLLEHTVSANPVLKVLQKLFTPLTVRRVGCHLDRNTVATATEAGLKVERHETYWAGIFNLLTLCKETFQETESMVGRKGVEPLRA